MTPSSTGQLVDRRRRPPVVVAVALGIASLTLPRLLAQLGIDGPDSLTTIAFVDVLAALVASVLLAGVARRRTGVDRRVWATMAIGAASWGIGSSIWALYLSSGQELPAPSPADAFYLVFPLTWCAALIMISGRSRSGARPRRSERVLDLLDSAIVALAMLLVVSVVAFRTSGVSGADLGALMTMTYPVADAVVLTLLVRAIRRIETDRRAVTLIAAGVLSIAAGDLAFLVMAYLVDLSAAVPTLVDTTWVVGFALVGGGAWIALGGAEPSPPRPRRVGGGLFPLTMGALAATVGLVDLAVSDGGSWTVLTLVLVMSLLLARQSVTLAENRRLSAELVRNVRGLEHQAGHDPLTSLPNREHLPERLQLLVASARPGASSGVMFLDIDLLKPINDSLGHRQGDRLICAVAERLRERWGEDVVRFGGDEFVVLLRHQAGAEEIRRTAEHLVEDMHRPLSTGGVLLQPSISVGVALVEPAMTADELLRRADVALYRAKQLGRRRAALFDIAMDHAARQRQELVSQLPGAVEQGQFELHYQPVVELGTGRVTTVEALLRWRHPDLGVLTPDRFLADADGLGLLAELGRRSLIEATTRFAEVDARRVGNPVRVTVNLSASELDARAVLNVEEALRTSGLDPSLLILEITEDVIVDDSVRRTLSDLRRLGVGIAIDDFGTGNSSLRQLGGYPASVLKIDRSFVNGIDGRDDRTIVRSIVDLAGRLGLTTVAEGVETVEQARLLHELGCGHAQGWLFERAVPFTELADRWLTGSGATVRTRRLLGLDTARSPEVEPASDQLRPADPQSRRSDASAPSMIRSSSSATVGSSSMTPTT